MPGDPCPKCKKPFANIYEVTCSCSKYHTYIRDYSKEIGEEGTCPITGKEVITTDKSSRSTTYKADISVSKLSNMPSSTKQRGTSCILNITVSVFACLYLLYITYVAILSLVSNLINFFANNLSFLLTTLSTLAMGLVSIAAVCLIFSVILTANINPKQSNNRKDLSVFLKVTNYYDIIDNNDNHEEGVYMVKSSKVNTNENDKLLEKVRVTKKDIEQTENIIRNQRYIIASLIIGATIGQIICFLEVKTLEEARATLQTLTQIGLPILLLSAGSFYGSVYFFKLENRWNSLPKLRKSLSLSVLLGAATVFTLIIVPPLFGEESPSSEAIAISIGLNIVCDVVINLLEFAGESYWAKR
jgi:hypothetical protein